MHGINGARACFMLASAISPLVWIVEGLAMLERGSASSSQEPSGTSPTRTSPCLPIGDQQQLRHNSAATPQKKCKNSRLNSGPTRADAGGSHEGYCKWMCDAAARRGWRAAVLNYRGCNGLEMTAPRGYNAAMTQDVHLAIVSIRA
eukprot:358031-Chlamydomonas_euryale.AAC.11